MNAGMLWYDNDRMRTLAEKIRLAADYYREKYGQAPNMCHVNSEVYSRAEVDVVEGIRARPDGSILPGYLWIGVEDGENREGAED